MSSMGTAGLFLPPGKTMNGEKCVSLLKSKLELHMATFMHDGALCHRSKVVKSFLEHKSIQMLKRPENSAGLNPIENVWSLMKNKVSENILQALMDFDHQLKKFG